MCLDADRDIVEEMCGALGNRDAAAYLDYPQGRVHELDLRGEVLRGTCVTAYHGHTHHRIHANNRSAAIPDTPHYYQVRCDCRDVVLQSAYTGTCLWSTGVFSADIHVQLTAFASQEVISTVTERSHPHMWLMLC